MPGIAELQPVQVQANSLGAVDQPGVNVSSLGVLPEFKDFMDAYKQGVITAEDIKRRQIVGTTGYEAEKAKNLEATAGSKQNLIDINEVRPLQRELAKAQTTGATTQQTLANQLNDPDPSVSIPAQEAFTKRVYQKAAIAQWGTATPRLFVNQDITPADFETWANQEVNSYRPGDNSPEANRKRAELAAQLNQTKEETPEYKLYVKQVKGRTMELTPGTPEYDKELRHQVSEHSTYEKLQQLQFETLAEFGKAQAKAAAEGPQTTEHVVKEFNAKTGQEDQSVVRVNKKTGDVVSKTVVGSTTPTITENQGKSASFASAMTQSENILDSLGQDFEPAAFSTTAQGFVPNRLQSDQVQLYNTAKKNWITAVLRQQSGAAIAKHEFTRYESQFFPQDGDSAEVIRQKKLLRDEQTKLMKLQAGPAGVNISVAESSTPAAKPLPRPTVEQKAAAPVYNSLAEVPSNVQFFKGTDNQLRVNPNFKP